jgi:PAS domain S-box-containing protein
VSTDQQPVEIILARGLMANLITPAFLVDLNGRGVFFNDAAGDLLGVRFEESGSMAPREWATRFEPLDLEGRPVRATEMALAIALRDTRPAHDRISVQPASGGRRTLEVSAFPIVGSGGPRGAMSIFWDVEAG